MPTKKDNYLSFDYHKDSESGKTSIWTVKNALNDIVLCNVKWRGAWRKYVIETTAPKISFDSGCLREISDFLDERTKYHLDALDNNK